VKRATGAVSISQDVRVASRAYDPSCDARIDVGNCVGKTDADINRMRGNGVSYYTQKE